MLLLSFLLIWIPFSFASSGSIETKNYWTPANQKKIDGLLSGNLLNQKSIAIFDWDNTMIKNDIGEAVLYWILIHNKLGPFKSWEQSSPFLTNAAIESLQKECPRKKSGEIFSNAIGRCQDHILEIYHSGKILDTDKPAWKSNFDPELIEPSYAWIIGLLSGYRKHEIKQIAHEALEENLSRPIGYKRTIGSKSYTQYIRYYEPMLDLLKSLELKGTKTWIVSASMQDVVEVAAEKIGISSNKVIGVRAIYDAESQLTTNFEGCGPYKNGNHQIITYRKGKRCWINKHILGIKNRQLQLNKPSQIDFAAGDSDTDSYFLEDARVLSLVINRNKQEVLCKALSNQNEKWILQPMFIDPLPLRIKPYYCSSYGLPNKTEAAF